MKPRLVGIAGPSCSGKSTLARGLCALLGPSAAILPLDAYYHDRSGLPPAERAALNFDHPDALDRELLVEQLRTVAAGRPIDRPCYRFADHVRIDQVVRVTPGAWIVVEGLFALFWSELCELMSGRIFVVAGHQICLERRIRRDTSERGRTADAVRSQYDRLVRPMFERHVSPTIGRAELILNGARPASELIALASQYLLGDQETRTLAPIS